MDRSFSASGHVPGLMMRGPDNRADDDPSEGRFSWRRVALGSAGRRASAGPAVDRIRIAYLAGTLQRGGAERELVNQLKALRKTRWDPVVFSLTEGEPIEAEIRALGVPVRFISRSGGTAGRALRIAKRARAEGVALVHSQHFFMNAYAVLVQRLTGIPAIGSVQSNVHAELESLGRMGKPSLFWPRWLTINSRPAYETAIALGRAASRTFLLENGLDLAEFESVPEPVSVPWAADRPVVIGVGSLGIAKRFDRFVEVIARAQVRVPGLQAVILGEGPLRSEIERAAHERGLIESGVLRLAGQRSDVHSLLPRADLFLFTSDYEGFPNAVQEALASGLPVVSTRIGAVPDIVEDGQSGLLYEREDVAGLADGVAALLRDPERRRAMARRGLQTARQRFGLERLGRDLETIYGAVLPGRPNSRADDVARAPAGGGSSEAIRDHSGL